LYEFCVVILLQFDLVLPFHSRIILTVSKMSLPNHSGPYWSNPPFNKFFDIRALVRSRLSARVPKCQHIKNWLVEQYGTERCEV